MSFEGKMLRLGMDFTGDVVDFYRSSAVLKVRGNQVIGAQQVAEADAAAPTAYSAHASGATPVTSNAATDLDTTAAAVETLRDEVATLTTKVNNLLAKLRTHGLIAT